MSTEPTAEERFKRICERAEEAIKSYRAGLVGIDTVTDALSWIGGYARSCAKISAAQEDPLREQNSTLAEALEESGRNLERCEEVLQQTRTEHEKELHELEREAREEIREAIAEASHWDRCDA